MTRSDLPSGTVTFLFSDIEGSTRLLEQLGSERYAGALADHRQVMRNAFEQHGGVEVDTQGDAFFAAFISADDALAAAADIGRALSDGPIRVRIGIHTGVPLLGPEGYVGPDVHRGARIGAAAHGGQVVLSSATRSELTDDRFGLIELGEHRLKDFPTAVPLFQLGSASFPPLRTISNTNLPRPASPLLGREREVTEIGALLRDGIRLLTLTGPGGIGKTRLAIESAGELVGEFKAGVFWVPLAPLQDPALVSATIGATLGAKDGPAAHIGEREMLLVLDNFEQVIDAAPDLAVLVETCPRLRVIATSRERLRVRGEREYAVPPLAEPDAVALFVERAQLSADETVRQLVQRLDNLPLAIELAAARASVLTPAQILERLSKRLDLLRGGRDAEARQQTLRATIDWSYDLLNRDEQPLFARLAVFRGGWTLDAAEEVCEADLDVIASLVDKSLVRKRDDRFAMLETIREFAAEKLEQSGHADAARRRHAHFFLALAEEAEPHLKAHPEPWLDRLDADHDNLRAACDYASDVGDASVVLRFAGSLYRFWYMRGYLSEGRARLVAALGMPGGEPVQRAKALEGAAVMAMEAGRIDEGAQLAREAEALHASTGNKWGEAYSKYLAATAAADADDFAAAQRIFRECIELFRELGDDHYFLLATDGMAWSTGELGDRAERRRLHQEVLSLARQQSNRSVVALQLQQLGMLAGQEGNYREAMGLLSQAVAITVDMRAFARIPEPLTEISHILIATRRFEDAATLIAASDAIREDAGGGVMWVTRERDQMLTELRREMTQESFDRAFETGRRLSRDDAVALAMSLTEAPG
jgi:predicted ATPase/class 3 adenylate cyclase